jgi:hypothetical protein
LDLPGWFGDIDREQPLDRRSRCEVGEDRLPEQLVVLEALAWQRKGSGAKASNSTGSAVAVSWCVVGSGPVHHGEVREPSCAGFRQS